MRADVAPVLVGLVPLLSSAACGEAGRLVEGGVGEAHEAPFSVVPDRFPAGASGTVLRSEPLPQAPAGAVAWQVIHRSTTCTERR